MENERELRVAGKESVEKISSRSKIRYLFILNSQTVIRKRRGAEEREHLLCSVSSELFVSTTTMGLPLLEGANTSGLQKITGSMPAPDCAIVMYNHSRSKQHRANTHTIDPSQSRLLTSKNETYVEVLC